MTVLPEIIKVCIFLLKVQRFDEGRLNRFCILN